LENRPGALAGGARWGAKVNILALLGTAGASGSVELVVEDARRARKALDDTRSLTRKPLQ
jgi:hypothetical protein